MSMSHFEKLWDDLHKSMTKLVDNTHKAEGDPKIQRQVIIEMGRAVEFLMYIERERNSRN